MEETVGIDDLSSGLGILVIAFHHIEAAAAHLTLYAHGTFLAGVGVKHFHLHMRIVAAHGGAPLLESVAQTSVCHAG